MNATALALATAGLLATSGTAFAQSIEIGPRGVQVDPYPSYRGRSAARYDCDELRRSCLYKQELGEEGSGNCRRYRRYCSSR